MALGVGRPGSIFLGKFSSYLRKQDEKAILTPVAFGLSYKEEVP